MKKVFMSMFLVLLFMLSACNSAATPNVAEDNAQPTSQEEDGTTVAVQEKSDIPIELTFFSLNGDTNTAKGEEAMSAVEQAIWEDLGINCNITMISSDSFANDQIAVKITAGELDAISSNMPLTQWRTFIDKGMMVPLTDLLEEHGQNIYAEIDPNLWDPYKFDGEIYLIPVQAPVPFYCSTWLRMDLFRKYGINTVPKTVSELIEGIKTVQANEPDLVGMSAGHISWLTNSGPLHYHRVDAEGNQTLLNDEGTAMEEYVDNDQLYIDVYWNDEKFKESLARFRDAYSDGVIDPEIFTTTFDHSGELVNSNRVIVLGDTYSFQPIADQKAGIDPEFALEGEPQEWIFLTDLVNDINGAPTTWEYSYETGMFVGIVANTQYSEEIIKILNWVCASTDNYALANWGVEGQHWNYDESGMLARVKDDSGNNVVQGGLGGMLLNIYSDWVLPLTEKHYGTEWEKAFAGPPETLTWTTSDGFINYNYETDAQTIADFNTITSEAIVNIVTGVVDLDEGLDRMVADLESAGYEQWYTEKNEQYMNGMGY